MSIFDGLGLTVKIRADITGLSAGIGRAALSMQQFSTRMGEVGKSMKEVGKTLSLYITLPLEELGRHALEVAGDYQVAMARVQAITNATGSQMQGLAALTMRLGTTTKYTATQAADALSFMAQIGYNAAQMTEALPHVLQLAAASGMELAEATATLDNVMAGYRMRIEDVNHAIDVMVRTTTASNTNLEELGVALKYAGPIASAAGESFEEVAAAIGLMGNAGIQGSMAGTSLRGALSRLTNPSKQIREAMQAAGVSFLDAHRNLLPLDQIIQQLEPHAKDAGLMMTLFGQRAGPAFAALVSMGHEALEKLTVEVEFSQGMADRLADSFTRGWNGAVRQFQSSMEALAIAIGNSGVLDEATKMMRSITEVVRNMGQVNPILLQTAAGFAAIAAAIPLVLVVLGSVISAMGSIFGILAGPVGLVALVIGAVEAFALFSEIKAQINGVAEAMRQSAGPMARITQINEELATASRDAAAALREERQANLDLLAQQSAAARARHSAALQAVMRGGVIASLPGTATANELSASEAQMNTLQSQYNSALAATNNTNDLPLRQRLYDRAMAMVTQARHQPGYNHDAWSRAHPNEAAILNAGNPAGNGRGAAPEIDTEGNLDLTNLSALGNTEPLPSVKRAQTLETLRAQLTAHSQTTAALEHERAVQEALNDSINRGEHVTRAQVEAQVSETEALQSAVDKRQAMARAAEEQHRQVEQQLHDQALLTEAAKQGEQQYELTALALQLMHDNTQLTMEQALRLAARIKASNDALARAQASAQRMADLARNIGDAFASAFEKAITEGGKFSDVIKGLIKDIALLVLRATVIQPIANWITGILNGTGGAPQGGGQSGGGIIGAVTSFISSMFTGPHANGGYIPPGKWGTVGERGMEIAYGGRTGQTIVPLGRGGGYVDNRVYNFQGTAAELSEFRRAIATIDRSIEARSLGAVRNEVRRGRL